MVEWYLMCIPGVLHGGAHLNMPTQPDVLQEACVTMGYTHAAMKPE